MQFANTFKMNTYYFLIRKFIPSSISPFLDTENREKAGAGMLVCGTVSASGVRRPGLEPQDDWETNKKISTLEKNKNKNNAKQF